jgi:prefoldin subunit 5
MPHVLVTIGAGLLVALLGLVLVTVGVAWRANRSAREAVAACVERKAEIWRATQSAHMQLTDEPLDEISGVYSLSQVVDGSSGRS